MVFMGIATVGAAVISKDNIKVKIATDVDVSSTGNFLGKLNHFIGIKDVKDLNDLITEDGAAISVSDKDVSRIKVKEDGTGLKINAQMDEIVFSMKRVIVALVSSFLTFTAALVSAEILKSLMKTLRKCETPFSEDVVKKMQHFAISLIPAFVLYSISDSLWSYVNARSEYAFSLDFASILLIALVFLLVYVFKYGAELQRESDETL